MLEFPPCEELKPGRERTQNESNREKERGPVGTEQRHSVSPVSHQPSRRLNPRLNPPPPLSHSPACAPGVGQSAGSGGGDVTVQSDFVRANRGMLLSPKREMSAGLIQTRPKRDRGTDRRNDERGKT